MIFHKPNIPLRRQRSQVRILSGAPIVYGPFLSHSLHLMPKTWVTLLFRSGWSFLLPVRSAPCSDCTNSQATGYSDICCRDIEQNVIFIFGADCLCVRSRLGQHVAIIHFRIIQRANPCDHRNLSLTVVA